MIDEYIEDKLKDKEFFEVVMTKAVSFLQSRHQMNRLRLYDLMSMRLGHTTGKKMLYKDIAKLTLNINTQQPVTAVYCAMMYKKGLRLARRAINALGKVNVD